MSSAQERKARCAEHRTRALDYVLGDLAGLERTRMEAHLDRCDDCRELTERLGNAFSAAKRWPPEPAEQDLEHLIKRLEPYFAPDEDEPRVPLFGGFARAVMAAAAATILIVVGVTYSKDQDAISTEPLAIEHPTAPEPELQPQPEIMRLRPRPFVKLVAGGGWDGKVGGDTSAATSIVMSRGFAVIDFEGAPGRKLWVGAPNASIEVIGTRFFVDTAPSGLTTVGVIAGKVTVSTAEGRATIRSGEKKTFGGTAKDSRSNAETYAEDPFLAREADPAETLAAEDGQAPGTRTSGGERSSSVSEGTVPSPKISEQSGRAVSAKAAAVNPLRELAAAQRLARGGDPRAALTKYDALLEQLAEKDALAPMIRYERARLLTFVLGERTRGEEELRAVAAAERGEASLQAKLSLCEMRLSEDRCAAANCLTDLRAREHGALSTEIDRLLERWQPGCDHK